MGLLVGKIALITGGSSGIGAACAKILAREGAKVAFTHLGDATGSKAVLDELAAGGTQAQAFDVDVGDFAQAHKTVTAVCQSFGTLDILVCNAGINRDGVIWKMEEAAWDDVIRVDLKGAFNYIHAVAPIFKDKKAGKIVAIASINGLRGKFGQANYAAAKAGVIGLIKTTAKELGKYGVNANVVCPGIIGTSMILSMPEEFLRKAVDETILGRMGTPEDIAETVAFLCSDRARHITGDVIKVDGGQYI